MTQPTTENKHVEAAGAQKRLKRQYILLFGTLG